MKNQRLASLRHEEEELKRQLAQTRKSLQRETGQLPLVDDSGPAYAHASSRNAAPRTDRDTAVMPSWPAESESANYVEPEPAAEEDPFDYGSPADADSAYSEGGYADDAYADEPVEEDPFSDQAYSDEPYGDDAYATEAFDEPESPDPDPGSGREPDADTRDGAESPRPKRTEGLVSRGRRSASSPWLSRKRLIALGTAAGLLLILILVLVLSGNGASWPASVTTVQNEITKACQNGDVASEPGQVNFACAKSTRQVLWVFSLLTSNDNPHFNDLKTGRVGLEPITPSEGGEVAWSLNLHHPYYPDNPVDSLEVAARAINNIIGGATLTASGGRSQVQPGLESNSANCLRYTGSAGLRARNGFPSVCARPVTSTAGQAALVADVYQKWMVGSGPRAAQNAAVLFENYTNPGDPQVQAVLRQLEHTPA
ncbi:MAG TPA: hypothetical protein VHU92_02750 [Streptosporangiaceae bacterium]|nr:hypothetical protein [Streptosporangiaceae bacterium]